MKKAAVFFSITLAVLVVMWLPGCGGEEFTVGEGVLTVGAEHDVPWLMGEGGVYEGFGFDVLGVVADELGLELRFVPTTIQARLEEMNEKRFDVLGAPVVITPERKAQMSITVPVATTEFDLVVLGQSPAVSREDTEGMAVGAVEASRALKLAQEVYPGREVQVFPHDDEMYAALEDGSVGVIVSPSTEFAWRNGGTGRFRSAGRVGEPTDWGFGVRKGNAELLEQVNLVLGRMKDDGSLEALQKKWLGE